MKPVLSVLFLCLIIVAIHQISASKNDRNKRFYDNWESTNDLNSNEIYQISPYRNKGWKKEDPCANKPLWYLKYQARLGKLSPFYDCLSVYRI